VSNPVLHSYKTLIRDGAIERDSAQEALVTELDRLATELSEYQLGQKSSTLGWIFGARRAPSPPRGLYVWGQVGRGKTMLMDLFFHNAPIKRKRRVHFHAFMADVHSRVHDWRQRKKVGAVKGEEPLAHVAEALADQAWLLCFDEFSVTDITDAMILGRLFQALFARGVVVVATSNVEPARLYEGGLNRSLFTPFIRMIEDRMKVLALDARTDFRLEKLSGVQVYHTPADERAKEALDKAFRLLTGHSSGQPLSIDLGGRTLVAPSTSHGVARFSFEELCERPHAAADFLAIARQFHTILIDAVPVMDFWKRNEARRFIWLIDALYDLHVKVIISAAAEPMGLYIAGEGREAFEFERTASRLIEMRSTEYLERPHGLATSEASGDTSGLVDT
jgi:cell division protein ZapE